ncbi:FHA domain-containing protein [Oscillospiraceae bacterium 50-16]|nr:FHA domain-containing protein [Lawsonibacter sp.]
MRRLTSILLALLLAGLLCTSALAAGSAEIVRAFVCDGTLYTYVSMDGMEKPVTKAEARVGGQTFSAAGRLETVRQAGAPVTWLLLVDNSTSMPAFRQEAADFAQSLAQSGGENTKFILATFGDAFVVRAEDVSPEGLPVEMEQLPFDERVTRLHTAISQGLDYFEGLPRQGNELRCMVVLSDGVQYDPTGGVPYEELLERVDASDVMLHSVGLGGDREALDSMGRLAEASGGSHQMMEEVSAAEAGSTLAEDSGSLFVTGFDLSGLSSEGGTEQMSVTFVAGSELVCRAEGQVELPKLTGEGGTQSNVQPSVPLPKPSTQAPGGAGDGTASPADPPAASPAVPLIGGIAAIVVVIIAAAVLLTRRKRRIPESSGPIQERQAGIYMRLELVRGGLAGGQSQKELELRDELMIGTDPLCDIVVQDGEAALQHVRLFSLEGAVYVEALDFSGAAQVNGEELQETRKLRSGDEVTVGSTVIRLKF